MLDAVPVAPVVSFADTVSTPEEFTLIVQLIGPDCGVAGVGLGVQTRSEYETPFAVISVMGLGPETVMVVSVIV